MNLIEKKKDGVAARWLIVFRNASGVGLQQNQNKSSKLDL